MRACQANFGGTFIAILALLGVLVPLFREWGKIGRREKALWTILMFGLVGMELRALYLDRDEHDAMQDNERCEQRKSFERIAHGIDQAILTSQSQFEKTMEKYSDESQKENTHFEKLLTQQGRIFTGIQNDTRDTLNALTGGDSYLTVMPIWATDADTAEFPLMIFVTGKNTMYDVTVEMQEGKIDGQYMASHLREYLEGKVRSSYHFAAVSTTYSQPLGREIHPDPKKLNEYNFWVFSRTTMSRESLQVKFDQGNKCWVMAYKVFKGGGQAPILEADFDGKITKQHQQ